jgi:hypothetical protein
VLRTLRFLFMRFQLIPMRALDRAIDGEGRIVRRSGDGEANASRRRPRDIRIWMKRKLVPLAVRFTRAAPSWVASLS